MRLWNTCMLQNEVDKFTFNIRSKFDITLNHYMLLYHLSPRGGFIFLSFVSLPV